MQRPRPGNETARRIAVLLLAALAAAPLGLASRPGSSPVRAQVRTEYEVKAAYLYNFLKFVEWPPEAVARSPEEIRLGIYGRDPFGGILESLLRGRRVGGRTVLLDRFRDPRRAAEHDVVFVPAANRADWEELLEELQGQPVLTVGEFSGFADHGGIINLFVTDQRVRFEINLDAAMEVNLQISSRLLRLARVIRKGRSR